MESDETFTLDMLPNPIPVIIDDPDLDFPKAVQIAKEQAREICSDPMLLSWYEKKTGRYSPEEVSCGREKPAWITYAESRGADITIDINEGAYIFIYYDFVK